MPGVMLAGVSESPLDVAAHIEAVSAADAGAIVTFTGVVRDHDGGREVTALEYQIHPTAGSVVAQVAGEIVTRAGVLAVAVTHRHGELTVGDLAIVAAVSAAHRGAAFAACSELIEQVKRRIPIWKRQTFADGEQEWVGSA